MKYKKKSERAHSDNSGVTIFNSYLNTQTGSANIVLLNDAAQVSLPIEFNFLQNLLSQNSFLLGKGMGYGGNVVVLISILKFCCISFSLPQQSHDNLIQMEK